MDVRDIKFLGNVIYEKLKVDSRLSIDSTNPATINLMNYNKNVLETDVFVVRAKDELNAICRTSDDTISLSGSSNRDFDIEIIATLGSDNKLVQKVIKKPHTPKVSLFNLRTGEKIVIDKNSLPAFNIASEAESLLNSIAKLFSSSS